MALDLPLPRNVLVHGHWTMNREKMSKSTGNVVNPFFAIDRFGVDGMRFFLAYQGGLADDADYDNEFISRDYRKMLQGGIGNLASRTIACAKGKLATYIADAAADKLPDPTPEDVAHQTMLIETPPIVAEHMTGLNPRAALQEAMSIIEKVSPIGLRKALTPGEASGAGLTDLASRLTNTSMRRSPGTTQTHSGSSTMLQNPFASRESCCSHSCRPSPKSSWIASM